jgi:3-methyladenine DNA glycosylase AlkD
MTAIDAQTELNKYESPPDAVFLQRFFKTGEGEYGAGDIFIGLRVPLIRKVAKQFNDLPLNQIEKLLESPIHEHRMTALIIMTNQTKKADYMHKKALYNLYLKRTDRINNWDLVDVSCRDVVGGYLMDKPRDILYKLAKSTNLWERRIAIVSTWQFIRASQLDDTFAISKLLISDSEDLIHKAVGWMLREAGKKDELALKEFLDEYAFVLPRTALRYSLERLGSFDKKYYMALKK